MLLTVNQASKYLGCNPETVRRWCREGLIDCEISCKRHGYRIDSEVIRRCRLHRRNKGGVLVDSEKDFLTSGERLRELRRKFKKSIEAVCFDTGIDQYNLSKFERGKKRLSLKAVKTLAKYYGVSTDYILCMDVEEEPND